jgi:circadian clock protein KaiB
MSGARLEMTELSSHNWLDFDMRLPGAGSFLGARKETCRGRRRAIAQPQPRVSTWKASMNRQAVDSPGYNLRLYIAGQTPRSIAAVCNLRKLCETYLPGRYRLDVIDLMEEPGRAQRDRIVAIPTLVRRFAGAVTRITGDFSNSERVLTRLNIEVRLKAQR